MQKVIFPGSFDPVTNGHLNVIDRATKLFDKVEVVISVNPQKKYLFTVEERFEMMEALTSHYENEVYLYKMLDQFNFDPSDEGAYYIAVARLVPNGDGTFSYTGAYQYMPVYYSPASNWEIVGMRNYTENILAGRYCAYYESSTYKVEVQENKDIPGLFRIKNAYLNYENNEDGNFSYQYEEPAREGVYF